MRIRPVALHILPLVGASLCILGCGSKDSTPSPKCMELAGYTATTLVPSSFATDIYPLLSDTNTTNGCGMTLICHGNPAMKIDTAATKDLSFVMPAATVLASLTMNSIHAPTMARVAPGSVANSFMAYKLSGKDGLACVNSMCNAAAGIGTAPCGDPMPSLGTITDADRTKILDWIANGANP